MADQTKTAFKSFLHAHNKGSFVLFITGIQTIPRIG